MIVNIWYSSGVFEDEEKEREHSSLQEMLDKELKELDKRLEEKEVYTFLAYLMFNKSLRTWVMFWILQRKRFVHSF